MPVERRTEGVGLALWWTRQRDRNHLRQRGEGNPPRTRHGRPTGGARQAGRAEIKSQRRRKPERKALYEARKSLG